MPGPSITAVGSLVTDLVVWLPHLPRRGETLHPTRFEVHRGGKGYNQAVAARRGGARVALVGKVGDDAFGAEFRSSLESEGIDGRFVTTVPGVGTSLAIPMVLPCGDNSILGVPRANRHLAPDDVARAAETLADARVLLLQMEVPVAASAEAARRARSAGATVLLNPAPAHDSVGELLDARAGGEPLVDWLVPNEVEASMLTGRAVDDPEGARIAGRALLDRGVRQGVVVTLGDRGAVVVTPEGTWTQPAFPADTVDPTGAGDAFCGTLAVGLADGMPTEDAVRRACAAGALSVTVAGAEPSMPTRAAVDALASGGAHP